MRTLHRKPAPKAAPPIRIKPARPKLDPLLITEKEMGDMLRISRRQSIDLRARDPSFPRPLERIGKSRLWYRIDDLRKYIAELPTR